MAKAGRKTQIPTGGTTDVPPAQQMPAGATNEDAAGSEMPSGAMSEQAAGSEMPSGAMSEQAAGSEMPPGPMEESTMAQASTGATEGGNMPRGSMGAGPQSVLVELRVDATKAAADAL